MSRFALITLLAAPLEILGFAFFPDSLPRNLLLSALNTLYGTLFALGVLFPRMQWFLACRCRAAGAGRAVALTFDDGPDPEIGPRLLDLLRETKTPAAFFYVAASLSDPAALALARRADAEGHLLGNHSYGHAARWALASNRTLGRDLERADRVFRELIGRAPRFYRPPFSVTRPGLGGVLKRLGLICVGWDARAAEGARPDRPEAIAARVLAGVRPGSILLLHERYFGGPAFDPRTILTAIRLVITGLRERGFEIKRLDDLLGESPYREP